MGPIVTLKDFLACFPYDDIISRYEIKGSTLIRIFEHILRPENRSGEGECYQVNSQVKAFYSDKEKKLESLYINGQKVNKKAFYKIAMQNYYFSNSDTYLNVGNEELFASGKQKVVTSSAAQEVLEEFLRNNHNITRKIEGRLVFK